MKKLYTLFSEYFKNREYYTLHRKNFWRDNRRVLLVSLILFIITVVLRSWPNYVNPNLYVEDTTHYFNFFYGNVKTWGDLLHNPNGYINILNNLLGMWVAHLDVRIQPHAYVWIATFVCIVAAMSFSWSGILKNKYLIFITPFLLGLSGLNHLFYFVTLTYLIYIFVIVLLSFLFWEPIKSNLGNFIYFLILSLLIWSGPWSVLTVPLALGFILFFRGKAKLMISLVVVTFLYLATVKANTIWLHNILNPYIQKLWVEVLVERIMFMQLAGEFGTNMLIAAIVITLVPITYFRKDTFYLKVAFLLFGLINGSLGIYLLSKKIAMYQRFLPCHLVIGQFLWLFLVAFTIDRFLSRNRKLYHVGGAVTCILFSAFIIYDNIKVTDKRVVPIMNNLPEFLDTVYEAEQQPLKEQNKVVVISYGNKEHFKPNVTVGQEHRNKDSVVERIHVEP